MYSDKDNVNILTALLVAHGIEKAVVCPGSRNAPIVHNLTECKQIECFPVTDERSAGFYALGLALQTGRPVVVCVTSGSAMLNVAPAVAEAFYRHVPLIVVSADRPAAWIGQLDGQTMPQPDALGGLVRKAVSLPEPQNPTERWHCNRLVNEALYLSTLRSGAPVHINVPISEPLFSFCSGKLPQERVIRRTSTDLQAEVSDFKQEVSDFKQEVSDFKQALPSPLLAAFLRSNRPVAVIGQMPYNAISDSTIEKLAGCMTVIREPLSNGCGVAHFDETVCRIKEAEEYRPDFVLYVGDTIVSKRIRRFLRQAQAETWLLTADAGVLTDPLMSLTQVVEYSNNRHLNAILTALTDATATSADSEAATGLSETGTALSETAAILSETARNRAAYRTLWSDALAETDRLTADFEPEYSQMATVKYLEEQLEDMDYPLQTHYANSTAVRLANIYAGRYVWCNRGLNGIEGCLSTAAGFSLATADRVFCVIGDLSFFYDQNALWNTNLRGNLRILLLNNGEGGIFRQLNGLSDSPAAHGYIAAAHTSGAQGICTQNDIGYIKATNMAEMQMGIVTLLTREAARPMLLEVVTDAEADTKVLKDYFGRQQ